MTYICMSPKSGVWTNKTKQNDRPSSWWDRSRWLCAPKNIVLFLATRSHQQLGFKLCNLPQSPGFWLRERTQDFTGPLSASGDRAKGKEGGVGNSPRPWGAWETGRAPSARYRALPERYRPQTTVLAPSCGACGARLLSAPPSRRGGDRAGGEKQ